MSAFFKLSGAGNDFIAFVEPEEPPRPEAIRAWCRRGISLGADGVFTLTPTARGARMVHYNADGQESDLCLNGSRCAAQLAFHLSWQEGTQTLELATDAGTLVARRLDEERVALSLPAFRVEPEPLVLTVDGIAYDGFRAKVGVPHFVLPWTESLDRAPVATLGPRLRSHPELMPAGANVNFVRFTAPQSFELRTFERGVEAETLACGTGVIASAATGVFTGRSEFPVTALTSGGFELLIEEKGDELTLAGDARIVAWGELGPGSMPGA